MPMGFLSSRVKITKVEDHTAAGTTDVDSAGVDMAGYEGVLFVGSFGTAAASNTLEAQQSTDDASFSALLGTAVSSSTSDEDVWIDVFRPQERYVRVHAEIGTSSTLESIWAIQYGARSVPVDNTTSGTITGEAHNAPAEGTA
jgi:hypothetical protein